MRKKVAPDGGRVIICGPSIRDLMLGADPFDHVSCVAELNGHYVFAAFEQTCLPEVTTGLVADLSLPEAQTICTHLLGRWVVFLTPRLGIKPKQSAVLNLSDWKRLKGDVGDSMQSGMKNSGNEYCRGILINVEDKASFACGGVRWGAVSKWKPMLFNIADWLDHYLVLTKTGMKNAELRPESGECEDTFFRHPETNFGLSEQDKRLLLICHFFRYWNENNIGYEGRGDHLDEVMGSSKQLKRAAMHAEHVEAACVNPSPDMAKRRFVTLAKDARLLHLGWPDSLQPTELNLLLAVLFPTDFASQMEKGLPVADLTKSSVKKEIFRPGTVCHARALF